MRRILFVFSILSICGQSCRTARTDFRPDRTYSPDSLKGDLAVLKGALEAHHPGLYWYQSPDEWKTQLTLAESTLDQPLTEPEFRKVLRPLVSSIRCGHTSIRVSNRWQRYTDTIPLKKLFPISVRCWTDTMVVLGNLDPKDSVLVRGSQILSINGRNPKQIYTALFPYIFGDGYNETHKYQSLSGWGSFGNYYRQYLDTTSILHIEMVDSVGERHFLTRSLFTPIRDTTPKPKATPLSKREKRIRKLEGMRSLQIDTKEKQALLRINSFGQGGRLRQFFKKGFRLLEKNQVSDLIIDVRNNGGGRVGHSTALTRYLSDHRFRIADSLYAVRKNSAYSKYIQHHWGFRVSLPILTRKRNGLYHFGYFERHAFNPKRKDHFSGKVYLLTGGNSFSATTLFVNAVKGQRNTTVIGEETGGGAYGNSAWMIPDLVLPNTGVRMRLPLFRMVMNASLPNNGRGIRPDVPVGSTLESVRRNYDAKMQKATQLIQEDRRKRS